MIYLQLCLRYHAGVSNGCSCSLFSLPTLLTTEISLPCDSPTHYSITPSHRVNRRPSGTCSKMTNCGILSVRKKTENPLWSVASVRFTIYNCVLSEAYRWRRPSIIHLNNLNHSLDIKNKTHKLSTVISTRPWLILFLNTLTHKNKSNVSSTTHWTDLFHF